MPFSCSDFGALKIGPKTGKTAGGLSSPACVPARAHSGLRGQTRRLLGIGDAGDENTPWSYYSYKDYKEYLNGDKTNEAMFSRYKNRKKEIQGRLESGNVDAKYDILGAISDESVRNRIIMVGAAQNSGTHNEGGFFGIGGTKVHDGYTVAPFSQCGEIVD